MPPYGEPQVLSTGVFLIDIDKRIRVSMRYSPNVGTCAALLTIIVTTSSLFFWRCYAAGRNFYEMIRAFDALQLATYHKVVCPANWGAGQDVLVSNDVSSEAATAALPKGFVAIKPWFRLTPCPDASS